MYFSQIDSLSVPLSEDSSTFKLKISVSGGAILNRSYSHYYSNLTQNGSSWQTKTEPSENGSVFLPGYMGGIQVSLSRKENVEFIAGIHFSQTKGSYYYSEYFQPKTVFPYEFYKTETGYYSTVKVNNFNYEAGGRIKIYKGFYITSVFVVHQNLSTEEERSGQTKYTYWSEFPEPYVNYFETRISEIEQTNTYRTHTIELSCKVGAEYHFNVSKLRIGVFANRNFGLTTVYPWWQSGIIVYLKK